MTLRRYALLALLFPLVSIPAFADERATSDNFEVIAPNKQMAKTFADAAERYRKEKALDWLGEEMPRWSKRCPLVIEINPGRTGGATTFTFSERGGVTSQEMKIFGKVDQLLESVLPHEITHTVLAQHFGAPVPRWADEGGSVLSENDNERLEHDIKCREFLNGNRGIPLRHLLPMKEYPRDTIVLYAEGFSVSNYLIDLGGGDLKGRQKFLAFLETGMAKGNKNWESAVKKHYEIDSVESLQEKWIESLKNSRPIAKGKAADKLRGSVASTGTEVGSKTELRSTATLGFPQLEPPVVNAIRASGSGFEGRASERTAQPTTKRDELNRAPAVPRLLAPER